MTKKGKARIVIGVFAGAAMAWSAATAYIPVLGPALADTAGLTLISVGMAYALATLYGKDLDTAKLTAFFTVVLGAIGGNLGLKMFFSLVPFFGSAVNASITGILHTAIGLVICEIFEEGKNLTDISGEEFKSMIERKKTEAEDEKKRYEEVFNSLTPNERKKVKDLQKRLKNNNISDSEWNQINKEIESIFGFAF